MSNRVSYAAGDLQCEICGKDMPAMECWAGRTRFYCDSSECRKKFHAKKYNKLVIGDREEPCVRPGCTGFAPAGNYDPRTKFFLCSEFCKSKFWQKGTRWVTCEWPPCGKRVARPKRSYIKHNFCSSRHAHLFRSENVVRQRAGQHLALLNEYIETFVSHHYRKQYGARNALSFFFQFLNEESIGDINAVTPRVITRFLAWEVGRGKSATQYLSYVKVFFDWMISEDRRVTANPVVMRIHKVRHPHRLPRPYSDQEMEFMWKLLDERGNNRLRLAFVMGEETGLRAGELCNVRLEDVDMTKQTIFVRLPNKTMTEGMVRFHDKTRQHLTLWLAERDATCGHDHLFHNSLGRPWNQNTLQLEFSRVLCKFARVSSRDKVHVNEIGIDRFSCHRLRHRMASQLARGGGGLAAIMAQGRWGTANAALGYVEIAEEEKSRCYVETMDRVRNLRRNPRLRTSSFAISAEPQPPAEQSAA